MESPNNVDETGMPLDHRPLKVVTKKGQKKVRSRTSGNKSQITTWNGGEIPGITYGLSDKGWVDHELFKGWLNDHLLKHAVGP